MRSTHLLPTASLVLLLATGCSDNKNDGSAKKPPPPEKILISGTPLRGPLALPPDAPVTTFRELSPEESGIDFSNLTDTTHENRRLYATAMAAGGVAIGDLDGDGFPDIVLTSGPADNAIYLQVTPASETATPTFRPLQDSGIEGTASDWGVGVAVVDIDSDGDNDIYICNHAAANQLYINDGTAHFTESASTFGLAHNDASHTPAFADYDRDGDLDLYLLTNRYYHPEGPLDGRSDVIVADPVTNGPSVHPDFSDSLHITKNSAGAEPGAPEVGYGIAGRPDILFHNYLRETGTPVFREITDSAGLSGTGQGLSATWWDYDEDGFPDLYVANDSDDPDHFFRNNGNGTFIDIMRAAVPYTPKFSMGSDFGDLNGDGHPDLLATGRAGTTHFKRMSTADSIADPTGHPAPAGPLQDLRNALYLGTGTTRFQEAAYLAGLAESDWTWSVKLRDFDNDTRTDVIITNGMSRDLNSSDLGEAPEFRPGETGWDRHTRAGTEPLREQNLAFRGTAAFPLESATTPWLPARETVSLASATADLDRDGDLDLVTVNLEEPVRVLLNTTVERNPDAAAVLVRLSGGHSHPQGIGARVTADGQSCFISPQRGYLGGDEPVAHFGLGTSKKIGKLTVHWPSGHVQEFANLTTNHIYTVTEPEGAPPAAETPPPPAPLLTETQALVAAPLQVAPPYDDFADQPLLPAKLSQQGPALCAGDVNSDGFDDIFIGGPSGSPGTLLLGSAGGSFVPVESSAFSSHATCEDTGAVFFDADGDSDLDLYVASGSSEFPHGSLALLDRLYINQSGRGDFIPAPAGSFPLIPDSTGAAAAADIDRDGDTDLFVGGRATPGSYPFAPGSRLLINDGAGKFSDLTGKRSPDAAFPGMVTVALFADADNDGWPDLLLATEWGRVRLFMNRAGILTDTRKNDSLPTGWWSALAAADVDADGDLDFLAGNVGLNTRYSAPAVLYAGDVDGTGELRIVEGEYEGGVLYPTRRRSRATDSIPALAEKFSSNSAFAKATLQEIYPPDFLSKALRLEATELRSGILENNGTGTLTFRPLPAAAQLAPVYGAAFTSLDGDASADLLLVGNSFARRPEDGRFDGGCGLALTGSASGQFTALTPAVSGFLVPGDAAGITAVDSGFAVAVHSAAPQHFAPTSAGGSRTLQVNLPPGSQATLHLATGGTQTLVSGYIFGVPQSPESRLTLDVRYPDGKTATYDLTGFTEPVYTPSTGAGNALPPAPR